MEKQYLEKKKKAGNLLWNNNRQNNNRQGVKLLKTMFLCGKMNICDTINKDLFK